MGRRAGEQGLARATGQARQTLAGPDQTRCNATGAEDVRSRGDAHASRGSRAPPIETASPGGTRRVGRRKPGTVARPRTTEAPVFFAKP